MIVGAAGKKAVMWQNGNPTVLSSPPNVPAAALRINARGELLTRVYGRPAYRPPSGGTFQGTASDDMGVVGVQFYADGMPGGPEVVKAPFNSDFDLVSYGDGDPESTAVTFWATARDAAGNRTSTNMKSLVFQNHCQQVATGTSINGWLGNQSGTFTVRFSARPLDADTMDAGFGLSRGRQGYFSGTSATVLFAPDGEIKVRNGASYPPSGVRYAQRTAYHFRIVVDVQRSRYSVWYKVANRRRRSWPPIINSEATR